MKKKYKIEEAAEMLRIEPESVKSMIRRGLIKQEDGLISFIDIICYSRKSKLNPIGFCRCGSFGALLKFEDEEYCESCTSAIETKYEIQTLTRSSLSLFMDT